MLIAKQQWAANQCQNHIQAMESILAFRNNYLKMNCDIFEFIYSNSNPLRKDMGFLLVMFLSLFEITTARINLYITASHLQILQILL